MSNSKEMVVQIMAFTYYQIFFLAIRKNELYLGHFIRRDFQELLLSRENKIQES